jgi:hypothetical protein
MATHCFIPLLGKRIRVTEMDPCGSLLTGAQQISTDGFITVTLSSEVEEGTEIITRKASGALCVNEKMADSFKRFTVSIDFCGVNPSLLSMVSNAKPYENSTGDVIGFTVPEGEIKKWFALELWTGLSGQVCAPGAEEASGYMLLPFVVAGVLGDIEIGGEDAITFSLTGAATKGGNQWGPGPYDVVKDDGGAAGPLDPEIDPYDHLLLIDTALAPPPEACDPGPVGVTRGSASPGDVFPAEATVTASDATNAAKLAGLGYVADPTTPWTTGQKITVGTFDFNWSGTAWAAGAHAVADDEDAGTASVAKGKTPVPA